MTTSTPSLCRQGSVPALGPTLADALAALPNVAGISAQTRQNMASAIRTLCRVVDREPHQVPVLAPALRKLFKDASPGVLGLSASRWTNVKSEVRRAIRASGLSVEDPAKAVPLTPAWDALVNQEPHVSKRSTLRRFGRYCTALGLSPAEVGDEKIEAFYQHLDQTGLSKFPERIVRDIIRFWNKLASKQQVSVQVLSPRAADNSYTLKWSDFAPGLVEDAAAYQAQILNPSIFDEGVSKVRLETAFNRDRMLRRMASAEVISGVPLPSLQSLADAVRPANLQKALAFFHGRHNGELGVQLFNMASLAYGVAHHWAKLPADDLRTLKKWVAKLRYKQAGLSDKNRARLQQFASPRAIRALLALPEALHHKATRMPVHAFSAMLMQKAVAIALLTTTPIRLNNLRQLDRHSHFKRSLSTSVERWHLVLPAHEVKNDQDLELPVPDDVMALINTYMTAYQPLLSPAPSSSLFPGRTGQTKTGNSLRRMISETIRKEIGLHMNPHLFRHLSAKIFLDRFPGQYETVRQFLGHRNIQTTVNFYAGAEAGAAIARYNDVLQDLRSDETKTARGHKVHAHG